MATKYSNGEEFVSALVNKHCPQPTISSTLSLNTYYKKANTIFNQALNYVKQGNHPKAYIELMKYSQLILKLSSHNQYNLKQFEKDKKINKRRLNNAILKLEEIKPQLIKAYDDKIALINAEKQRKEEKEQQQQKQQKSLPASPEENKLNKTEEIPTNQNEEIASYPSLDNNVTQTPEDNPWSDESVGNKSYPSLGNITANDDQKIQSKNEDYPTLDPNPTPSKSNPYSMSPKINAKPASSSESPQYTQSLPPQQSTYREPSIPSNQPFT